MDRKSQRNKMCLIFLSFNQHPDYPLIIAANRDEFYDRPASSIGLWPEYPNILAGKDLTGGGTWLGVTKSGYFSMLTNYRDMANIARFIVKEFPSVDRFVFVSTDKAVRPTNVMGASKRIAEMYVQSLNNYLKEKNPDATKFITTRFGNVLGSNGSVIPVFKKQIDQGGPITVTHPEITRFFMTIPEACQLVLEAGAMGEGGEIFVFDMGKSIKIVDLAKKMVKLSGLEVGTDIEIVFTGLRSGEKLYEELLSSHENTLPTYHHKILIAKTREVQYENVKRDIQVLLNSVQDHDELKLVGIMKYIVPEFKSNSSKFEVLDKKKA